MFEVALYEVYETVVNFAVGGGIWMVGVLIALFALYAVHTLTVWLSGDPERAFHNAKIIAGYSSTAWNTAASGANALADTANELLPSYNMLIEHTVQPAIWTGLEISSLVFFHQHYTGMISEDQIPFEGHDCGAHAVAGEDPRNAHLRETWCGNVDAYAAHLGVVKGTGANVIENGTTLIMNTPTARRLQALVESDALSSGKSLIGVLPIQPLLDVVEDISGVIIELVATGADVFFDVVYTILEEVAVLIFNLIMTIARMAAQVMQQIVQSGILQSILKMGADILMVLVFNVALPLLFAVLDLLMCLLNLMQPGTWGQQLQCSEPPRQTRTLAPYSSPPSLPPPPPPPPPLPRLPLWQSRPPASRRAATSVRQHQSTLCTLSEGGNASNTDRTLPRIWQAPRSSPPSQASRPRPSR